MRSICAKLKFFALPKGEEEDQKYRMRFTKKKGDLMDWYELFNDMKTLDLEGAMIEAAAGANAPEVEGQ